MHEGFNSRVISEVCFDLVRFLDGSSWRKNGEHIPTQPLEFTKVLSHGSLFSLSATTLANSCLDHHACGWGMDGWALSFMLSTIRGPGTVILPAQRLSNLDHPILHLATIPYCNCRWMFTLRETVDRHFGSKSRFSLVRSFAPLPSRSSCLLLCSRHSVLIWDINPAKPATSSLLRFRVSSLRVLQPQLSQHLRAFERPSFCAWRLTAVVPVIFLHYPSGEERIGVCCAEWLLKFLND